MNEIDNHKALNIPSPHLRGKICELCANNDQEDLYIVFDVLYRVFMFESFHEKSSKNELYYESNRNPDPKHGSPKKGMLEEPNVKYTKLKLFQSKISDKLLHETFLTNSFNQLMQEIFKIKYSNMGETSCNHSILAEEYIKIFGTPTESNNFDMKMVQSSQEKIEHLKTSLKEIKLTIDSCHAEINDLCSHVLNRLFDSRPQIKRKETNEEESKMDSGENGSSGDGKDSSEDKFKGDPIARMTNSNNNGSRLGSNSGGLNGSNGNQESGQDGSSSNGNGSGNANANSDQSESNPRKDNKKTKVAYMNAKSKLPKKATDILKNWFLVNIQNPYPNYDAKEALSKVTGLTRKQIQNWFTNSRKRFLEPLRKKLQTNQDLNIRDMNSPANENFNNIENNHGQNIEPPKQNDQPAQFVPESNPRPQYTEPTYQTQPNVTYISPQNYQQPMIYQAHMATNPNGGSFMVLTPCIIQNPIVYSYRPVQNIVPINNNFIQFQPNHMQVINQPYIEQPYMIPTNVVDFRGILTQSMSTNFNTINNNVYNSINKANTDTEEIHTPTNLNNLNPMGFGMGQDRNTVSMNMPDMELDQNQGAKSIGRDEEKK